MILEQYQDFLPVTDKTPRLTLGEGNTPLVAAPRLARDIGVAELWLKFEGMNPSGSFGRARSRASPRRRGPPHSVGTPPAGRAWPRA